MSYAVSRSSARAPARALSKPGGGGGCCDDCSCNCVASGCCPDCVTSRASIRTLGDAGDLISRVPWGVLGGLAAVWYLLKK